MKQDSIWHRQPHHGRHPFQSAKLRRMLKTVSAFLMIVLLGLLSALAEIQAQQTSSSKTVAARPKIVTLDELKTRRAAIGNRQNLDAELKADSQKNLDGAIAELELAAGFNQQLQEISQLIEPAPARLKVLQAELKKPYPVPDIIREQAQQMDIAQLEQQLSQEKARLAVDQAQLQKWNEHLSSEKTAIRQLPEKRAITARRINEIQAELADLREVYESDIVKFTKMLRLNSEREKLNAESKLNAQRQQSHNLLLDLFGMEVDVARRAVQYRSTKLAIWQAELQKFRQQEATQAQQEAREAMTRTRTLPRVIQDQFDINIQLAAELEDILQEEGALRKRYNDYQSRLRALEKDLATNKRRFEYSVLTEDIGLTLHTQRLNLPSVDQFAANAGDRQRRLSEISEKQVTLGQMLPELAFPNALVQRLVDSVMFLSDIDRQSFDLKIQELIANRIEIVEKLKSGYNRISKLLQDIGFTTQNIINTANNLSLLLDRHLLWIRSSKRLSKTDLLNLGPAFRWAFGASVWSDLWQDVSLSVRQHVIIWSVGIIMAVTLLSTRHWTRRKLRDINTQVQQQPWQDSISLSLKALALTVLLAVIWPFIIAFPSLVLLELQLIEPHTRATASGLLGAAKVLLILNLLYHISGKNGLAHLHFRWAESARQSLRHNLAWFIPIAFGCHFIVPVVNSIPAPEYSDSLVTFALMIWSVAVVIILIRTLRFKGGITSVLVQKDPKSWLARMRYVWFPLVIAIPLLILYLTAQGYYYSALKIDQLMSMTTILIFGLIILKDMVLRLLMLTRRKIALQKARMVRQLQLEKQSDPDAAPAPAAADADQASPMESTIGMEAIDEQTRTLLKTGIFILGLAGLWSIWKPVFPALGILQNVDLWKYTMVIDGVSQLHAITLADTVVAVIIIAITIISVRNLPGLLEIILLNRLPMDPGARYAYAAIFRYSLTAVGIIVALNIIGIRWSSLRWLVAALGVGIGFGLQEIVANFICGLIILFERPVRVGDIVTVGTTEGIVTKIRIRATTIRDWDLKELLVPNKEFVTTRLLNWSLSDRMTRLLVPVGVALGSNIEKAFALMKEAAAENEFVLADPEPVVSFDAFGDYGLTLTLRAYLSPAGTDNLITTRTELHQAINQKFTDAGIEISLPQRNVHLDTNGPLDVRVMSGLSAPKSA